MIEMVLDEGRKVVNIPVTEHFHKQDYEQFVPEIVELIRQHKQIRILFDLGGFNGWDNGALWFGIRRFAYRR